MKTLNRNTKIGIAAMLLLILCVVVCILALYSNKHPNETLIINKSKFKGYSFKTSNGVQGVIYPRFEITVVNAFRIRKIHISGTEWEAVVKWQKYNTKHPLKMYY